MHVHHSFLRLFGVKGKIFVFVKLYSAQGESLIMKKELKKMGTAKEN